MPEIRMDELLGPEASPRPGFEDELAARLHRGWHHADRSQRRWWQVGMAVAAVAAATVLVVVLTGRDGPKTVTVDTSPVTAPDTGVPQESTPPTEPSTAATAPQPFVAIGDSVMVGAVDELRAGGVYVDAKENRGPGGVKETVISLRDAGVLGDGSVLVVQVGTISPMDGSDLAAIVAEIPSGVSTVYFMTVHGADVAWIPANNELIRSLPSLYPGVQIIDWDTHAGEVELCGDGIHLTCGGTGPALYYTKLILNAVGMPVPADDAQQTVLDYLRALAEGRWADAALPLWEGGLEPEARADLRPLFAPEYGLRPGEVTHEALAVALERWCADGCGTLVAGLSEPREGVVVVTFDFGVPQRSAAFTAGTFEGQPLVNGLPLRVPPGVDPATIVDCASAGSPVRALSADLDGDGWAEQIVVVDIPTHIGSTIMVCGTDLEVALMDVPAEPQVWVAVVRDAGSDVLLIDGRVYAFDGTSLVDQGVDASFTDSLGTGTGTSVGCGTWGGSEHVALRYTYTYEGGNSPDTATVMHVTVQPLLAPDADPDQYDLALPADIQTAVEIVNGWCDGLPVRTG